MTFLGDEKDGNDGGRKRALRKNCGQCYKTSFG